MPSRKSSGAQGLLFFCSLPSSRAINPSRDPNPALENTSLQGPEKRTKQSTFKGTWGYAGGFSHSYQGVNCDIGAEGKGVDEAVWRGSPEFKSHGCPPESCDPGNSCNISPPPCPLPVSQGLGSSLGGDDEMHGEAGPPGARARGPLSLVLIIISSTSALHQVAVTVSFLFMPNFPP